MGKSPDLLIKDLFASSLVIPPNFMDPLSDHVVPATTVDPSNGGCCGKILATDLMKNFAYCLDECSQHSFSPSSQVMRCLVSRYMIPATAKKRETITGTQNKQ